MSARFDAAWYRGLYSDVAAAGVDPLKHFMADGWKEGRWPNPLFDPAWYLARNPDVAAAGINPLLHYVRHGEAEGRVTSALADGAPSVARETDILARFHGAIGWHGTRPTTPRARGKTDAELLAPHVDVAWYRAEYPDVAATGVDPLAHFMTDGWKEGRWPNPRFDPAWYLERYDDVAASGANPLLHYVRYGRREGRMPTHAGGGPRRVHAPPPPNQLDDAARGILARMDLVHGARARADGRTIPPPVGETTEDKAILRRMNIAIEFKPS